MLRVYRVVGFVLVPGTRIDYRGRRSSLRRTDIRHIKRLARLAVRAQRRDHTSTWLLAYRTEFRSVLNSVPSVVLAMVLQRTPNLDLQRLLIWLLGRRSGTLGIKAIARVARRANLTLRREAARALRRKQGWAQLRELCSWAPADERLQRLATGVARKSYRERLSAVLDDVSAVPVAQPSHSTTFTAPATLSGRPPKSSWRIRELLEHVRALVHASLSKPKANR